VQQPGPTPWANFVDVWNKTIGTIGALIYSKQTGVGAKDLSGPVGIFAMLAAQVSTDYRLALNFLVLLNINLAILNLLPIPVLDGGHILMALFEKIRGRPLSLRFIEYATTGFALLLISFMLYVTFFDLKRLPLIRLLFDRETRIEQPASVPVAPSSPADPVPAPTPGTP
jgi:regulator of sigma E protease